VDLCGFVAEREADGACACEEFDDFLIRVGPGFDFLDHGFKEREMRLGKGAGMESDRGVVNGVEKEWFAVDELPSIAKNAVVQIGLEIKPDRMPEIVFEERLAESGELRRCIASVEDEDELDPVCGPVDGELDVAEMARMGIFGINRNRMSSDFLLDDRGGLVDRGVVDAAMRDRDDFVRPFFEEADFRWGADGEFGFEAGGVESVRMKDGT